MFRRFFILGLLPVLAACAVPQSQTISPQVAPSLRVADVMVDVSTPSSASVRGFTLSDEEAERILASGIKRTVAPRGMGDTPVRVSVKMKTLYVPNPAMGILFGSNYPSGSATVQVLDARSGDKIGEPFEVLSGGVEASAGELRPGMLGAALQDGEKADLASLSLALGERVGDAIFGAGNTR